ncbi:MAG: hypothetical protein H6Q69_3870 [Firmicutes bacterium]|nr:hypothetical protein [Bacillota bacterium]
MSTTKWKEILDLVDDFADKCTGPIWFRGHSKTTHSLKSGLFRLRLNNIDDYLALEQQFYNHYKSLGHLLHNGEAGWSLLYSMQHYGVKSRLLDWTESFSVALFFAARHWTGSNSACIWLLNPIELNYRSIGERKISIPTTLQLPYAASNTTAIYPIKNTNRIAVQHGVFTVQGNTLLSLDQEFDPTLIHNGILTKIDLPFDVREDVCRFLKKNGINHFSLFPDMEGLSTFLNQTLIQPAWE